MWVKIKQFFCLHWEWSDYRGYNGKPHHNAHCLNCGKPATKPTKESK